MRPAGAQDFTPEDIERSLTALALCGGNSARARELLENDDTISRIPAVQTLRAWRSTTYADRYKAILEARAPEIEAAAVHDYRAIVARTNAVHLELVDRASEGIDNLDAKDAAQAARNLAIAGGVAADKLLVFTDRPNVIHSKPDPQSILTQLQHAFGIKRPEIVESTAEDESDSQGAFQAENGSTIARETA